MGTSLGKGKGTYTWYSASSWNTTSEALRYGSYSVDHTVLPANFTVPALWT